MQTKKVPAVQVEETSSEARGDGDAAVAKTAAIKNIQKALTARILKRIDEPAAAPEDQQPQVLTQEKAKKHHHHNEEAAEAPAEDSIKTKDLLNKVKNAAEKMKKTVHEQDDKDYKTVELVNKVKTSA